jgi:hypothetical protein
MPPAIYDEIYAYGTEEGILYAAFEGSKSDADDVVVYIEFAWLGDGVSEENATALVEHLVPADAAIDGVYFAPPTPDGEIAFLTFRYESESLASVSYGTGALPADFLVLYHTRITDVTPQGGDQRVAETAVLRVTMMTRIPEA